MRTRIFIAAASSALMLGLGACSAATPSAQVTATPSPSTADAMKQKQSQNSDSLPGSFISRTAYEANPTKYDNGDVVLFFNASWCPTCQEAEGNLTSQPVPDGVTIVDVDYDSNTDLRQEYGVTTQHTFSSRSTATGRL